MTRVLSGYVTLDDCPSHAMTFHVTRCPSGTTDIEIEYRHTGRRETIAVSPGSELYLFISQLVRGLDQQPGEAGPPRLRAIA